MPWVQHLFVEGDSGFDHKKGLGVMSLFFTSRNQSTTLAAHGRDEPEDDGSFQAALPGPVADGLKWIAPKLSFGAHRIGHLA
jgi:hypothetical protein